MKTAYKQSHNQSPLAIPAGLTAFRQYDLSKLFMKSISLVLIWSFFWTQVIWAAGGSSPFEDCNEATFQCEEASSGPRASGDGVEGFNDRQQAAVDHLNAINELIQANSPGAPPDGLNFTLTDADGNRHIYVDGELDSIVTAGNTSILRDVVLNAQTGLIEQVGNISLLQDGVITFDETGRILTYTDNQGRITTYNPDGTAQQISRDSQILVSFSYKRNTSGQITSTRAETADYLYYLDASQNLTSVYDKQRQFLTVYANNQISFVLTSDWKKYTYQSQVTDGTTILTLSSTVTQLARGDLNFDGEITVADIALLSNKYGSAQSYFYEGDMDGNRTTGLIDIIHIRNQLGQRSSILSTSPDPNYVNFPDIPIELLYNNNNELIELTQKDGSKLFVNSEGVTLGQDGEEINVSYAFSSRGSVLAATFKQNDLEATYDAQGSLQSVKLPDLTIFYSPDKTIARIETKDHYELVPLEHPVNSGEYLPFIVNNQLVNFTLISPDGSEERDYIEGKLYKTRSIDITGETEVTFDTDSVNIQPISIQMPDKSLYTISLSPDTEGIESSYIAELQGQVNIPNALTPITMHFDANMNLRQTIDKNNQAIRYLETGRVDSIGTIINENGLETFQAKKIFVYQDGQTGYSVQEANSETFYTLDNKPLYTYIHGNSTSSDQKIVYEYDKARWIYSIIDGQEVPTHRYSYVGEGSDERVIIEEGKVDDSVSDDFKVKTTKTYKGNKLLTSLDHETDLTSTYSYDDQARVQEVRITYMGDGEEDVLTYSYQDNKTIVHSKQSGAINTYIDNKLVLSKRGETTYAYTYRNEEFTTGQPQIVPLSIELNPLETSPAAWSIDGGELSGHSRQGGLVYATAIPSDGNLELSLDAKSLARGAPGPESLHFEVWIANDSGPYESKGIFDVQVSSDWSRQVLNIPGIEAGQTNLKLVWLNDAESDPEEPAVALKSLNLKVMVPQILTEEVIVETIVSKRLEGGALVEYEAGVPVLITGIDSTGSFIDGIKLNSDGTLKEARLNLADGTQKVFNQSGVTEAVFPADSNRYLYSDSKLRTVIHPLLGNLNIQYSDNPDSPVRVEYEGYLYYYGADRNLRGMEILNLLNAEEAMNLMTGTANVREDGYRSPDGPYSSELDRWSLAAIEPLAHDLDPTTSMNRSFNHGLGNEYISMNYHLFFTYAFTQPQTVSQLMYKFAASGWGHGNYGRGGSSQYRIEYRTSGSDIWQTVSGTSRQGGNDPNPIESGYQTLDLPIADVIEIRAYVASYAEGSDHGGIDMSAHIYEFTLSIFDQAYFAYDAQGGTFLNAAGGSPDGDTLRAMPDIDLFKTLEGAGKLSDETPLFAGALSHTMDALIRADEIFAQDYSSDGQIFSQNKGDRSVMLFTDFGKPELVLNEAGETIIEYTYDAERNLESVYLKKPRDELPASFAALLSQVEADKNVTVQHVRDQEALAIQNMSEWAAFERDRIQKHLKRLEEQWSEVSRKDVHGREARKEKNKVLDSLGEAISNAQNILDQVNRQENEAYASINNQVAELLTAIDYEYAQSLAALRIQENELKRSILRQETAPIVFDVYRRILGRDPSVREYEWWLDRADYDSAQTGRELMTGVSSPLEFDGTAGYLELADSSDWFFGFDDFTIETFFNVGDEPFGRLFRQGPFGGNNPRQDFTISNRGVVYFIDNPGNTRQLTLSATFDEPLDPQSWHHVALQRKGNVFSIYVDGAEVATAVYTGAVPDLDGPLLIGHIVDTGNEYFKGHLDDFRISKGIARYSEPFDISLLTIHKDAYTKLLINGKRSPSGDLLDDSPYQRPVINYGVDVSAQSGRYTELEIFRTALLDHLQNSAELLERRAYKEEVLQKTFVLLGGYHEAIQNGSRDSFIMDLFGQTLSAEELESFKTLSSEEVSEVKSYLLANPNNLHFGQSAFISLETILIKNNISYDRTTLAARAIFADAASRVITKLDEGKDLVLSLHALNLTARSYNVGLAAAQFTEESLKALYQTNPDARVILHIQGDHFIVVESVSASGEVTYTDPGIGKDLRNEKLTLSLKELFEKSEGYASVETQYLNLENRVLSAQEAQKVRGAFLGSWLGFLGSILTFIFPPLGIAISAIASVVSFIEGDFLGGILSFASVLFGPANVIGDFFKSTFQGVVNSLGVVGQFFSGIGSFLGQIYEGVTGVFKAFTEPLAGFVKGLPKLAGDVVKTGLAVGVNYGISRGLEAIGIDPAIAGAFGSLAAGAVVGSFGAPTQRQIDAGITQTDLIRSSVRQTILINQVGQIGLELDLDPALTNIIGLSLGAIQGDIITNPGTTLERAFNNVLPSLAGSLAQWGIQELGTFAGLDSGLSNLIGVPIGGFVNEQFNPHQSIQTTINAINDGLVRGVLTLSIEYLGQNSNPLIVALGLRLATGVLADAFHIGQLNPNFDSSRPESANNLRYIGTQGLTDSVIQSFISSFENIANLGIRGDGSWARAQYLQRLDRVSDRISEVGFAEAIDDLATQVMTEDSISEIIRISGAVKYYLADALDGNRSEIVIRNGINHRKINLQNGDYLLMDLSTGNLVEYQKSREVFSGELGKDPNGSVVLINGSKTLLDAAGNPILIYQYRDGVLEGVLFRAVSRQDSKQYELYLLKMANIDSSTPEQISVSNLTTGEKYTISKDGVVQDLSLLDAAMMDILWTQVFFLNSDITDFDLTAREIIGQRAASLYLEDELQAYGGPYLDILLGTSADWANPFSFINVGGIGRDVAYMQERALFNLEYRTSEAYQNTIGFLMGQFADYVESVGLDVVKNIFQVGLTREALVRTLDQVKTEAVMNIMTAEFESQAHRFFNYSSGNLSTKAMSKFLFQGSWFNIITATLFSSFSTTNAGSYTETMEHDYFLAMEQFTAQISDLNGLINVAPSLDFQLQYLLDKQNLKNEARFYIEAQIASIEGELRTNNALDNEARQDLFSFRSRLLLDWQASKTLLQIE